MATPLAEPLAEPMAEPLAAHRRVVLKVADLTLRRKTLFWDQNLKHLQLAFPLLICRGDDELSQVQYLVYRKPEHIELR